MVDFGVLSALRDWICREKVGEDCGLSPEKIYIMIPHVAPNHWPVVFLELEESWRSNALMFSNVGKVILKVSILNQNQELDSFKIANQIQTLVDGASLDLSSYGYGEATFRLNSSVVDFKKNANTPRKVEQYYEALIHSHVESYLQEL